MRLQTTLPTSGFSRAKLRLFRRANRYDDYIICKGTELQDKWLALYFQANTFPYSDAITSAGAPYRARIAVILDHIDPAFLGKRHLINARSFDGRKSENAAEPLIRPWFPLGRQRE